MNRPLEKVKILGEDTLVMYIVIYTKPLNTIPRIYECATFCMCLSLRKLTHDRKTL